MEKHAGWTSARMLRQCKWAASAPMRSGEVEEAVLIRYQHQTRRGNSKCERKVVAQVRRRFELVVRDGELG